MPKYSRSIKPNVGKQNPNPTKYGQKSDPTHRALGAVRGERGSGRLQGSMLTGRRRKRQFITHPFPMLPQPCRGCLHFQRLLFGGVTRAQADRDVDGVLPAHCGAQPSSTGLWPQRLWEALRKLMGRHPSGKARRGAQPREVTWVPLRVIVPSSLLQPCPGPAHLSHTDDRLKRPWALVSKQTPPASLPMAAG